MISWQTRWVRLKALIIIETGRHMFIISPTLSTFHSQDQLIAELERLQLELDQLRSRPGGSYSRLVPFRHKHLKGSETLESSVWSCLTDASAVPMLCLFCCQTLYIYHSTLEAFNTVSTHRAKTLLICKHTHWLVVHNTCKIQQFPPLICTSWHVLLSPYADLLMGI